MAVSFPSATLSFSTTYTSILRRQPSSSFCLSFISSSSFSNNALTHHSRAVRSRVPCRSRRQGLSCNCLFGLGVPELVVIAGVAALVFGPKKLPEVGRSIGKTVKSFQQAAKEFETELKKGPDSAIETPMDKPVEESEEKVEVSSTKESV